MRRKRTHKAVKRPDLSGLKEALKDDRVWCAFGIVIADDGGGSHFEIEDGEVLVDVELQPSEEEITALVSSPVGGLGVGVFAVPPVGSEVIVAIPDGEIIFQPTIVGVLTSGNAASGLSGTTVVIVAPEGGKVLIHDGAGVTEPLIRKSEYDALKDYLDLHTHPTGVGPSSAPEDPAPSASGTSVLEGK